MTEVFGGEPKFDYFEFPVVIDNAVIGPRYCKLVTFSLGLRRCIEIAPLPDDVVLQLDGLAERERHRRRRRHRQRSGLSVTAT